MTVDLNDYLSKKLKVLSLSAVILVVFLHSHNEEIKFSSGELVGTQSYAVLFIENFLSKGIAKIAVPLFFAISGFLFYNHFEFTANGVLTKLKGRFKNLFIPYLFWSVFGLVLIFFIQAIPWSRSFFTKDLIVNYTISELLSTIFLNPIPYQLWFVRDLIMLSICSPIIWYLTKSTKSAWLVPLALLWTAAPKTFELFSNEALFFFAIGSGLALEGNVVLDFKFSRFATYGLLVIWLLIVLSTTYLLTSSQTSFVLNVLNNAGIVVGLLSVWSMYDQVNQEHIVKFSSICSYSFFIFVFHEPMLTMLKKGLFFWLGRTNFTSLLIYVIAPSIAIALSMLVRYVLRRGTPQFYRFVTGGR